MSRLKFRKRRLGIQKLERREVLSASPITTFFVDDDLADIPNADYTSIQEAVDAADANDRIVVAPGTYEEAVTIDDSKNGLQLGSQKRLEAIIRAPSGTPFATLFVDGANDVRIKGFTIHGTPGIQAAIFVGGDDGSATVSHNHIAVRDSTPLTGTQNGIGVLVGHSSAHPGSATATIEHNLIDNYQKGGIVVNGAGSSAKIAHNEVVGTPATYLLGQAAQNGIQVSGGADAEIHHNVVVDNNYTPNPNGIQWVAAGILVFGAGDVEISHNTMSNNDVGVYVFGTDGVQISHNKVHASDIGILLWDVEDALVKRNDIRDSSDVGLWLYNVTNSDLLSNRAKDNGLDFLDNNEGENNWHKNKGELVFA